MMNLTKDLDQLAPEENDLLPVLGVFSVYPRRRELPLGPLQRKLTSSAKCELAHHPILRLQRMSAMRAANASFGDRAQGRLWAASNSGPSSLDSNRLCDR